jgi:structural maintenance of chromosome 3 (chondroitin sulfate proteoglycan 6)
MIENSIRSNLEPQLERIELKLLESAKIDDSGLFALEEECQYIQTLLSSLTESLNQTVNVIDDLNDAIETHISRIEKQKTQLAEENAIIEKQQLIMQKLLTKKALYSQKKETALAHIRNLGVLPEEAFEKYQDSSSKQVFEHLI